MPLLIVITVVGWIYALFCPTEFRLQTYIGWHADHLLVFIPWTFAWLRAFPGMYMVPILAAVAAEVIQIHTPAHVPELSGAIASLIGVFCGFMVNGRYGRWLVSLL